MAFPSYVADWEENRQEEIRKLTNAGILPHENNVQEIEKKREFSAQEMVDSQAMVGLEPRLFN